MVIALILFAIYLIGMPIFIYSVAREYNWYESLVFRDEQIAATIVWPIILFLWATFLTVKTLVLMFRMNKLILLIGRFVTFLFNATFVKIVKVTHNHRDEIEE